MKNRMICLFLAGLILFGAVAAQTLPARAETATEAATQPATEPTEEAETEPATEPAQEPTQPEEKDTDFVTSADCIRVLKAFEGFSKYPYYDYGQYTVGYGTKCPDDKYTYYKQYGITEEEAEALLRSHLSGVENEINVFSEKYDLLLRQNQFDALVCFSYNCGTGWLYESGTFRSAVLTGATGNDFLYAISLWCNAGGSVLPALVDRRLCEANMYLNGAYSSSPPEHYGYVLYEGNGGSASPRVQGYDTSLTADFRTTARYEGYSFVGWFTSASGGKQVSVLNASVRNARLYARWKAITDTEPEPEPAGIRITVTGSKVNLRQGPGTNYTVVGMANTGDEFLITETATGSGYTWGKYDGGWICLKYTNYDEVMASPPESPEGNDPTDPTEPEPTDPEPTEPEPTEPEPTEPEPTEPVKVMGTVKVRSCLNVRSGAGTGYSIVTDLPNGARVEILEQKTVDSVNWGRIDKGWISMQYVELDRQEEPEDKPSTDTPENTPQQPSAPEARTGTVNYTFLRIRKGPGTGYAVVGELKKGDKVTITQMKTVGAMIWGQIDRGWISMDYIDLDPEQKPEEKPEVTPPDTAPSNKWTGKVNYTFLRIRSGPGTQYAIVGQLSKGDKVTITQMKTVGSTIWGQIDRGWISMDYIDLDKKDAEAEVLTGKVNYEFLRIRSGPGTSYAISGYLYEGDRVQILERRNVGATVWGRIDKGWISLDYIDLDAAEAPEKVVKTVTASCLRIRKEAGTGYAVVGYLYKDAKVEILETKTVEGVLWGRVSNGWISMEYVK